MSYYQFNKKEILQKAKEKYCKRKGCWILFKKQRKTKRKVKNRYNNLPEEGKDKPKEYQRKTSAIDTV